MPTASTYHEMYIEMTRGRSDIYDILTHLTFLYAEANKIHRNSMDDKGRPKREWGLLADIVEKRARGETFKVETAYTYLSTLLGRTYDEVVAACRRFAAEEGVNDLFHVTYYLGLLAKEEAEHDKDREISFSSTLREKTGHHYYGELWAQAIKKVLTERKLIQRPIHIISANLHSVANSLFAPAALGKKLKSNKEVLDFARSLSQPDYRELRPLVFALAEKNGMTSHHGHQRNQHWRTTLRHGRLRPQSHQPGTRLHPRRKSGPRAGHPGNGLCLRRTGLREHGRTAAPLPRRRIPSTTCPSRASTLWERPVSWRASRVT